MKRKDTVTEAADSMREPWEAMLSELRRVTLGPMSATKVGEIAIRFVSRLMPGERAEVILAVAKRLITG